LSDDLLKFFHLVREAVTMFWGKSADCERNNRVVLAQTIGQFARPAEANASNPAGTTSRSRHQIRNL